MSVPSLSLSAKMQRLFASGALLAITASLFALIVTLEAEATTTAGREGLTLYGTLLLLGVALVIDIAWFSAMARRHLPDDSALLASRRRPIRRVS